MYWVPTDEVDAMDAFDGIWVLPGSPYRSEAGAISAVRTARERGIPFLGTCGGFQHAMLEYARNVCGATGVQHAENTPEADDLLIVPLACSLDGHEAAVEVRPGIAGRAAARCGAVHASAITARTVSTPRGRACSRSTVWSSARTTTRARRGSPSCPGTRSSWSTLFQPELSGDGTRPHPFIQAFAHAAAGQARPARGRRD